MGVRQAERQVGMADATSVEVAVVGAGLAGTAVALGCAQLGLRVALVGQPPAVSRGVPFDLRIYALAPSTVALLQRLRVWDAMDLARTQAVERMRVFGDEGRGLSFDAYGAAVERLATIVEEAELARVLAAACGFATNLAWHKTALSALRLTPSAAQLQLENGMSLTASLVIAADGARSEVRAAAGIAATTKAYGQTAVVANFACQFAHDATASQWFTHEGVMALLPLPTTKAAAHAVSLVWSAPDALATELAALPAAELGARIVERVCAPRGELASEVDDRARYALGELTLLGATGTFPLRCVTVAQLVQARVALVGDAAHVVHPLAGQGLNLGLQDVADLLDVLSAREPFRDLGDAVLLRRYARARAEAVALMQAATDGLARLFAVDDPLTRRLRNVGLAFVNQVRPLKRALIRHALG